MARVWDDNMQAYVEVPDFEPTVDEELKKQRQDLTQAKEERRREDEIAAQGGGGIPGIPFSNPGFETTQPYVRPGESWGAGDWRGGKNWTYNPYQQGTPEWRIRQIEIDRRLQSGGGAGSFIPRGSFAPGGGMTTTATNPLVGTAWEGQASSWQPRAYQNDKGILQFDDRDFEALEVDGRPVKEARPFVDAILRAQGWKPAGQVGLYGATRYEYSGTQKPQSIWFAPTVFSGLPGNIGRAISGLFGKKGWTTTG